MSAIGDALKGIKELLLLQHDVRSLEKAVDGQGDAIKELARDLIGVDRRVGQLEGIIRGVEIARKPRLEE